MALSIKIGSRVSWSTENSVGNIVTLSGGKVVQLNVDPEFVFKRVTIGDFDQKEQYLVQVIFDHLRW